MIWSPRLRSDSSRRPHSVVRAVALGAVVALAPLVPGTGLAAKKPEHVQKVKKADALFVEGDYEGALAAYRAAYKNKRDPELFIKMGMCFEKLGQVDLALDAFKRYLSDVPSGGRHDEVQALVAALQTPSPPAEAPASEAPVGGGDASPSDVNAGLTGAASGPPDAVDGAAPDAAADAPSEGPGALVWVVAGTAALVLLSGGVVAAVLALQPPPEPEGALGTYDLR